MISFGAWVMQARLTAGALADLAWVIQARLTAAALADLVLPAACAACGLLGAGSAPVCADCAAALVGAPPLVRWPEPVPHGLPPPWAIAAYAGPVRELLLAHKEQGRSALVRPLGDALGRALMAAAGDGAERVFAVPIPSAPAAIRQRGRDPMRRLARRAVASAARGGAVPPGVIMASQVILWPALTQTRRPRDQAGLSAAERGANLAGALALRRDRAVQPRPEDRVILLDDVVTTGATLAEAARALQAGGIRVDGAAVVAATVLRSQGGRDGSRLTVVPAP